MGSVRRDGRDLRDRALPDEEDGDHQSPARDAPHQAVGDFEGQEREGPECGPDHEKAGLGDVSQHDVAEHVVLIRLPERRDEQGKRGERRCDLRNGQGDLEMLHLTGGSGDARRLALALYGQHADPEHGVQAECAGVRATSVRTAPPAEASPLTPESI